MNKKLIWGIVIVVVVLGMGWYVFIFPPHSNRPSNRPWPVLPVADEKTDNNLVTPDSENVGDFVGYYTEYTKIGSDVYEGGTCQALTVLSGNMPLINYYSNMVDIGNSVNRKVNGNLVVNLDLSNVSALDKAILQKSTIDKPVTITIQKKKEEGMGAPLCYSFFNIVKITN